MIFFVTLLSELQIKEKQDRTKTLMRPKNRMILLGHDMLMMQPEVNYPSLCFQLS